MIQSGNRNVLRHEYEWRWGETVIIVVEKDTLGKRNVDLSFFYPRNDFILIPIELLKRPF